MRRIFCDRCGREINDGVIGVFKLDGGYDEICRDCFNHPDHYEKIVLDKLAKEVENIIKNDGYYEAYKYLLKKMGLVDEDHGDYFILTNGQKAERG